MTQSPILTVTFNPALDVCADVAVVAAHHKLHCTDATRTPGGGGINVARAVHRLGGEATALFPYGGSTGQLLCDLLAAEGVPVAAVPTAGVTRVDFAVRETSTGREYRFVLPGAALGPGDADRCVEEIVRRAGPGSFVVISGSLPSGFDPTTLEALVAHLHRVESHVVADTSGPALATLARSGALVLKPSRNELTQHAGRPLTSVDDVVEAADDLRRLGPNRAVLVSLGADGAVLVTGHRPPCTLTAPDLAVVSTVGAGDSLVGGLVLALATGHGLVDAARRGVAAGCAATLAPGHHLCDPVEVAALLSAVSVAPISPRLARRT